MTISYRASYAVAALLLLTVCASQQEAQQLPKLRNEIGHLNQRLRTLTNQAVALVAQNEQNQQSTRGIYQYPVSSGENRGRRAKRDGQIAGLNQSGRSGSQRICSCTGL